MLCSLWWVQILGYVWHADRIRLFVQYTISLSSLWKLIWRHCTYKMLARYILSNVWVRLSLFSPLSIIHMWGCMFSVYPFLVMIERMYILCLIIIIKSEVWTITHCLGLGYNKMVSAVSFYILILLKIHITMTFTCVDICIGKIYISLRELVQWNLSVTTTPIIKPIIWDLFKNVFKWRLKVPIYSC